MVIKFFSSKNYEDPTVNNGDCILIDNGSELVIYDCGCEEHADRVITYMDAYGYSKAKLILSHNDSDHFNGIPKLIEQDKISEVYALLLLKYKKDIWDRINVRRIREVSLTEKIRNNFDNIYSLGGKVELKDILKETSVAAGIEIVGPDKEYALNAVAKQFDGRESDQIDNETIVNAVSTQVRVDVGSKRMLLCGDSSFEAIEDKVEDYTLIQLPHHGKAEQANKIFDKVGSVGIVYYVSDNTGNSNGGSDDLPSKGYTIKNTKDGDQECDENKVSTHNQVKKSYFRGW